MKNILIISTLFICISWTSFPRYPDTVDGTFSSMQNRYFKIRIIAQNPKTKYGIFILEIDSCEYIEQWALGGYTLTHKGNCKNPIHKK